MHRELRFITAKDDGESIEADEVERASQRDENQADA